MLQLSTSSSLDRANNLSLHPLQLSVKEPSMCTPSAPTRCRPGIQTRQIPPHPLTSTPALLQSPLRISSRPAYINTTSNSSPQPTHASTTSHRSPPQPQPPNTHHPPFTAPPVQKIMSTATQFPRYNYLISKYVPSPPHHLPIFRPCFLHPPPRTNPQRFPPTFRRPPLRY